MSNIPRALGRRHWLFACLLVGMALLLNGCTGNLSAENVADRFWRAVVTGHPAKIRKYVVVEQRKQLEGDSDLLAVAAFHLGRIVIDGERATIETAITLAGDTPVNLNINTRLVRQDAQWRVDYDATVAEISMRSNLAQVIEQIGKLGTTLQEGVNKSVEELNRAIPAIERELSRIEAEIQQRMPELREKLEAFSKRIEEAIKAPPPAPTKPEEESGTIAL